MTVRTSCPTQLMMLTKLGITTPDRGGQVVPPGHVLVSEKLRGQSVVRSLREIASVTYSPELEKCGIDFCPSSGSAVMYFSGERLPNWQQEKEKIIKLRKAYPVRGIVIAERTPTTQAYFSELQHLVVGELGLEIMPVLSSVEVPLILTSVLNCDTRYQSNPFLHKDNAATSKDMVRAVSLVPKLGEKKARLLLERFGSISNIAGASLEDLSPVIGMQAAISAIAFFSDPITEMPKK